MFTVDGIEYTLAQMIAANEDDSELCEWLRSARPGDYFPNGTGCECTAAPEAA